MLARQAMSFLHSPELESYQTSLSSTVRKGFTVKWHTGMTQTPSNQVCMTNLEYKHFLIASMHEFQICAFFSGRGILADVVTPVAVGIAGVEVVKAQLTQTSSNLFTGGLCAYFEFLTKQFTSHYIDG